MENYTGKKIATFRERFVELCSENPTSDTALADALRVSKQTISAWKSGTRSPKAPTVVAIAKHFKVDMSWLLGFDVEKKETEPDAQEILEKAFDEYYEKNGYPETGYPRTREARVISEGIDKMDPARREQALKVLQAIFADIFDGSDDRGT